MSSVLVSPGAASPGFDALLLRGATWVLVGAGAWLVVVVLAAAVETLSRGRVRGLARVGCPAAWRPVVLLVVGAALALPSGAAHAAAPREPGSGGGTWLSLPTRPVDTETESRTGRQRETERSQVLVRAGDTLWGLARERLAERGAEPGDAAVAAYVAATHHANRAQLRDQPDLIHPGQRLVLPPIPPEGARP